MREIKFRAWDKKNNSMITQDNKQLKSLDLDSGYIYVGHYKGENAKFIRFTEIELMQYTGLKDKNGREIYEGDVVTVEVIKGIKITVPISFEVGAFHVNKIPDGYGFFGKSYLLGALFAEGYNIEVIGNIYENKELLEG